MNATRRKHSSLLLSVVLSVSLISSLSHAKRPPSGLTDEAAQAVRRALQRHGLRGSATVSTSVRNVRVARTGRRLDVSCEVRVSVAAWGSDQTLRDGSVAVAKGRGTVTVFSSNTANARRRCVSSVAEAVANNDIVPFVAAQAN